MYLKRLELQGFKSFADKTVLEFKPGITSVIGPNGSGKSNISDSIRWVLGEQSMKSLRGAKSEDVIFNGTQNRKSLGFAEASIVIDNSDGSLPIEYNEVTVTRKLYRSGESGYFINKVPCRLKDVVELFMDTGIGKDGYSIIGQGKIDEILSNKSEDRRHIFEEAAGIVKYRVRKGESEKKLEQTKLNLLRINDILSEIETNLDPLRIQAEKARQFLDLREELKNIEVGLFLHNIGSYKEKLEQVVADEDILVSQRDDETSKLEEKQQIKEKLKSEIDSITAEIESMQNLSFESTNKIEKLNTEIGIANERISNNKTNSERLSNEIEEVKARIKELEEEKQAKVEKKNNIFSNKEKFENELKEKEAELAKLSETLSGKELEIEEQKQKVQDNTDNKYEIGNEISTLEANFENFEKREKTLKTEITEAVLELDVANASKQEISKGYYEIEAKKNKVLAEIEKFSKEKEGATNKIKEFDDEINRITYDIRMKDSRCKFLIETEKEKEGYTKSVKSLLLDCDKNASLKAGVHGVLANLISVDGKYQTAIEMALGGALQNIVTDNEQNAKKLVEHLRANNLGRASFLPISSIKGGKIERLKCNIDGYIGIASDLVKCDRRYENIVQNLLGRTVVVNDMDCGIQVAKANNYAFRIVTLKGDIISNSGAITGGSVSQKTVNILGRSNEIEKLQREIKELEAKLSDVNKNKEKFEKSVSDVISKSEELENSLNEINIVYATENQKMVAIEENISKVSARLEKLRQEDANIKKQKEEILKSKEEKFAKIEAIDKENEELNSVIEQFALLNKDNQKYIDDLNFDITNLRISVSSFDESGASIDEMVERIELDIKNNNTSIENKEKQIADIGVENEELVKSIEGYNNEINTIKSDVANSSGKIDELKAKRVENNSKLEATEKEITDKFGVIEGLKEQLVKIDVKKTKFEQDIKDVIDSLWNEYELTPNTVGEEYKKPDNVQNTQKEVNKLRNKIRDLGSINIDSIEEYKKNKERYDFMSEQRLDLENTQTKLRNVINDMTKTMKTQFAEKFALINKNFNEVFQELFGGGKAELVLEDEENILECGIDIRVQPTGKKLQNMMLLSGGERAFTAIALLFAILKINPAPFCILDEIEAALDDVNVYRFADYLKKFSHETQFLVITHRKGTMEAADTVYGITMEENGISKLLSMKMS